jgi:LacI family transcriptional regulator
VARRAGVSPSTASRALNGLGELSDETRAAVRIAAQQLNYRPSRVARSLRTRVTKTIGVIVPTISHPFYAAVTHGAQSVLDSEGYSVVLVDSGDDPAAVMRAIEMMLAHEVDGLLVCTAPLSGEFAGSSLAKLVAQRPCVFIDEVAPGFGVGEVVLDNEVGVSLLVDHLVEHGHRHICYIGGPSDRTSGLERLRGFSDAVARHGLETRDGSARDGAWTVASGFEQATALLTRTEAPTAIVTASAELAIGALAAARRLRVGVPDQLALACFDDPFFAPLLEPSLTCITYDTHAIGAEGAGLLLAAISDRGGDSHETRVSVRLVRRRSCGCRYDPAAEVAELLS